MFFFFDDRSASLSFLINIRDLYFGVSLSSPFHQIVSGLPVPPAPFLFGLLLRGVEIEWAKLFPARLLLLYVIDMSA